MSLSDQERQRIEEEERIRFETRQRLEREAEAQRAYPSGIAGYGGAPEPSAKSLLHVAGFLGAAFVIASLLYFVIPRVIELYRDLGVKELPWMTQVTVDLSDFLRKFWFFLPFCFLGMLFTTVFSILSMRGQQNQSKQILRILFLWFMICLGATLCLTATVATPFFQISRNLSSGQDDDARSGGALKE